MTRKGNRSTRNGGADAPQAFDEFWPAYPRKVDKDDARKAFAKLNIDDILLKTMLAALAVHCRSDQWVKDAGKFVPYPSTWLNKKRWQDEGAGTGPDDSDHPAWALRAGFNNRYEAENDGCHEHNADAFSNGTRKEHA